MKKLENKYRVVEDDFSGYEAQVKFWWIPIFWFEMHEPGFMTNTWRTLDEAKYFINSRRNKKKKRKIWNV